jgi:Viral BACON domain
MTAFDELLSSVRTLNDPDTGVASALKGHLRNTLSQRSNKVKREVARLNDIDDNFVTKLQDFIDNTSSDDTALLKLITLIEGYLAQTHNLYDSLLNLKYGKTGKAIVDDIQDALRKVHEALRKAKTANLSAKKSLLGEESVMFPIQEHSIATLTFTGTIGGAIKPPVYKLDVPKPDGEEDINWHWKVERSEDTEEDWLMVMPLEGSFTGDTPATIYIAALLLDGMKATTHQGTIKIHFYPEGEYSARALEVGHRRLYNITFNVQEPCFMQSPNPSYLSFNANIGSSDDLRQTFTVDVNEECTSSINVTAIPDSSTWLMQVIPTKPQTISSAGGATFTVVVNPDGLPIGVKSGSISLNATDNDSGIVNQQTLDVFLNVNAVPILSISPTSLPKFYLITNQAFSSQPIEISNIGSGTMNWQAQLDTFAPNFITLSANKGSLEGGYTASININFNTNSVKSGTTATTRVSISATDSSGKPVGSPVSLQVDILVTDNLFLCVMNQLKLSKDVISQTQALFDNVEFELSDKEIDTLTTNWQAVVDSVANQPNDCSCLSTSQEDLILINGQFGDLFNKMESLVTSE